MWQRFTERARRVVFFAQEEAGLLGENYVSTEHLLLGMLRENDSVAARILDHMGISRGRIRSEIERQVTRGDGRLGQDMELTPRAKKVIDLAYDEANQLKNNYIGTEHMLLGLIREAEGLAGRVLNKLGVDLERTRSEVAALQNVKSDDEKKVDNPAPPRKVPLYGDLGVVRAVDGRTVAELALDAAAFVQLTNIFHAKDAHGYREMSHGDQTMTLLPDGTALKRLVPPQGSEDAIEEEGYYVRVVAGDHIGYAGWISASAFAYTGSDDAPFPPEGEADKP